MNIISLLTSKYKVSDIDNKQLKELICSSMKFDSSHIDLLAVLTLRNHYCTSLHWSVCMSIHGVWTLFLHIRGIRCCVEGRTTARVRERRASGRVHWSKSCRTSCSNTRASQHSKVSQCYEIVVRLRYWRVGTWFHSLLRLSSWQLETSLTLCSSFGKVDSSLFISIHFDVHVYVWLNTR